MSLAILLRHQALLLLSFYAVCTHAQVWTAKQNIPPNQQIKNGICFEAGNNIFLGGGENGNGILQYNVANNTWAPKTSMPGNLMSYRDGGISFTINGKAYVGAGVDFDPNTFSEIYLDDLWEYNDSLNTWEQKASFAGGATKSAVFVINGKAYVAGGYYAAYSKELWEYDPVIDTWTKKANMPMPLSNATGFSIGGGGYVVFGASQDTATYQVTQSSKVYQYLPDSNKWYEKNIFPGTPRSQGLAFMLNGTTYVGTGLTASYASLADMYAYDPIADNFTQVNSTPGAGRFDASSVIAGNRVFMGNGENFQPQTNILYNDWYEITTASLIHQTSSAGYIKCYPNPAKDFIMLDYVHASKETVTYKIYNAIGQQKVEGLLAADNKIELQMLPSGDYFLLLTTPNSDFTFTFEKF